VEDHQAEVVAEQLRRLVRRAEILRQIHSDKMFRVDTAHRRTTVALVAVTAVVGFFGFTGTERLQRQIAGVWSISLEAVNMLYNTVVLLTVLLAIAIVVYRLPERAAHHHRAIQALSEYKLDIENRLLLSQASPVPLTTGDLDLATERYKGLVAALPPRSDKEFLESKQRYLLKKAKSHSIAVPSVLSVPRADAAPPLRVIETLISSSPLHSAALDAVQDTESQLGIRLYLCGGFVRNLVWDHLHNYAVPTALDDVDVVFIASAAGADIEAKARAALADRLPNIPWSARNLSTLRPKHGTGNYADIESALRESPETASAVAVRQTGGELEMLAPLGTGDLFAGIVRPTHESAWDRVLERARDKRWLETWPRLQLIGAAGRAAT
jgi:hypothetical protein